MKAADRIYRFKVRVYQHLISQLPDDQKVNLGNIHSLKGCALSKKSIDEFIDLVESQIVINEKNLEEIKMPEDGNG